MLLFNEFCYCFIICRLIFMMQTMVYIYLILFYFSMSELICRLCSYVAVTLHFCFTFDSLRNANSISLFKHFKVMFLFNRKLCLYGSWCKFLLCEKKWNFIFKKPQTCVKCYLVYTLNLQELLSFLFQMLVFHFYSQTQA